MNEKNNEITETPIGGETNDENRGDENRESPPVSENLHDRYVRDMETLRGFPSVAASFKYWAKSIPAGYRTTTPTNIVTGVLFLASLTVSPFLLAYYFGTWWHLGFVGFVVGFGGTILSAFLAQTIHRKRVTRAAEKDKDAKEVTGVVVASARQSECRVKIGTVRFGSTAGKILYVFYKVKIKLENGKKVIGYSKNRYYERGETIRIRYNPRRPRRCYILPKTSNP